MSELKLVVENAAENAAPAKSEGVSSNPWDALNRRDIELIKKSLINMNKDSADLRNNMILLYQQNNRVPSKTFFVGLGLLWFLGFSALTIARPHLDVALQHLPGLGGALVH
jgi:hypothetical protein